MKFDVEMLMSSIQTVSMHPRALLLSLAESTNEAAADLLLNGAEEGTFVLAAKQEAGKGRKGRVWHSPVGGLYMSVIIKPIIGLESVSLVTFLAGCAVVSSLEEVAGLRTRLKWPNDVLAADRKVGGILCELITEGNDVMGIVIGVGINVNTKLAELPDEVHSSATTVLQEVGHKVSLEHLAGQLITEIDRRLFTVRDRRSFSEVLDEWREHNCILGRQVRVEDDSGSSTGVAMELTTEGALIVRKADGSETVVTAGDVNLL